MSEGRVAGWIRSLWEAICPELTAFPDRPTAIAAYRLAESEVWSTWRGRAIGAFAVVGILAMFGLARAFEHHHPLDEVLGAAAMLVPIPIAWWTYRPLLRYRLREALRESGIAVCLQCGFQLDDHANAAAEETSARRCPECGVTLDAPAKH